jgi:hypothetical protein
MPDQEHFVNSENSPNTSSIDKIDKKIKIGSYDIISSGSLIVQNSQPIEFKFDDLIFKITFINDTNVSDRNIDINVIDSVMNIKLLNQNNSFFSSPTELFRLAVLNGRRLSFKFSILSINSGNSCANEDKIFYYTWYLGEQVNN